MFLKLRKLRGKPRINLTHQIIKRLRNERHQESQRQQSCVCREGQLR